MGKEYHNGVESSLTAREHRARPLRYLSVGLPCGGVKGGLVRLSYDSTNDVLSIVLDDNGTFTKDLDEDVSVVINADGQVVEVQLRDAMARFPGNDIFRQIVLDGIEPFTKSDPLIILPRIFKSSALLDDQD